jgi:hypothetical protein
LRGGIFTSLRAPLLVGLLTMSLLLGGGLSLVLLEDGSSLTRLTSVTTIPASDHATGEALVRITPDDSASAATDGEQRVRPVLECIDRSAAAEWLAYFGYDNLNDFRVDVAAGPDNRLSATSGQPPTSFSAGRIRFAFVATVGPGETVTWALQGRAATATAGGVECDFGPYRDTALPRPVRPAALAA